MVRAGRTIFAHRRAADFDTAAGLWFLIHGGAPGAVDKALDHLVAAVRSQPTEAGALNDLAAGYLVRAGVEGRPADLIVALDTLERSLSIDPALEEARFNKGLALASLGLCRPAATAWREALGGADPRSGWTREAERRRALLVCDGPDWEPVRVWATGTGTALPQALAPLLAAAPVEVLRRALEELLPAWADALLAGDRPLATIRWMRIRWLGESLSATTGDVTIVRAAEEIRAAAPRRATQLALAYQGFGAAARLQSKSLYAQALEGYRHAMKACAEVPAEIALWARYGVLSTLVTEEEYPVARGALADLRAAARLNDRPALAARLCWSEGLMQLRTGAFAESRQSFMAAAAIYTRMHESFQAGAAQALEAESLHALGLDGEAWRLRVEALHTLGSHPSGPLHNALIDAAMASREDGNSRAALALQTAGLDAALAMRSVSRTVEALLWRSKILADLGRTDEAQADLRGAIAQAPAIADPGVRRRLSADLQEAFASLQLMRDPAAAVATVSASIGVYREKEYAWKLPSVLLLRARARMRLGQADLAAADLEAAVEEFERRDRTMPPEVFRYSHFERAQEIFDEMIRLQLNRRRSDLALAYAERARRALWPYAPAPRSSAAGLAVDRNGLGDLRATITALPAWTACIELAVLGDRLLTWVVYEGKVRFYDRPLDDLPARVEAFSKALATPSGSEKELERMAESLYGDLVAPWAAGIPLGAQLVFVPDRFLYRLPLAALREPARQRWLAQDFVVSTAPSLRFAAGIGRPPGARGGRPGSILVIGDPRFDRAETGELPGLPGAVEEVRRIASLYTGATVLTGAKASRDRVLAALAEADVVHYAGHALVNARDPWVSFLALARPAAGGSGLLLARDIDALPRRERRVVVLSACGSASDGRLRAAGFAPLVSAFLASGAESVVASLWSITDDSVLPLSLELHRGLHRGLAAPEALHLARLRVLETSPESSPRLWASLQVAGVASPHQPPN
jgi:CHAT domain-containing protein